MEKFIKNKGYRTGSMCILLLLLFIPTLLIGQTDQIPWDKIDIIGPESKKTEWYDISIIGPESKISESGFSYLWLTPLGLGPIIYVILTNDPVPPPTMTCKDITVNCVDGIPPPDSSSLDVQSECEEGAISILHVGDQSNNASGCQGDPIIITRTYRVTDGCGNEVICIHDILIGEDSSIPSMTCPEDVTLYWGEDLPSQDVTFVSVSDDCTQKDQIIVEFLGDQINDGTGCSGSPVIVTRNYQATDLCGNTAICSQVFTYEVDDEAPVITCPEGITLSCGETPPSPDINMVMATDNCSSSGDLIIEHLEDIDNGGSGCPNSALNITRIYQATDLCGNTASCSQFFTYEVDDEAPVITCPEGITLSCGETPPSPDIDMVTATDNCSSSGDLIIEHLEDIDNGGSGCPNSTLNITRIYQATDLCGNTASCSQVFTYEVDDEAPVITCPEGITLSCGETPPSPDINMVTATDNCSSSGDLIIEHLEDIDNGGSGCFNSTLIITRIYQATDLCGNTASCSQVFTYELDEEAPVITCPEGITLSCGETPPSPDIDMVTAIDNCSSSGDLIIEHLEDIDNGGSGCFNSTLIITRIYQATDLCGNTASCSQVFTYEVDEEAPVITCPEGITLSCGETPPSPDIDMVTATDNCSSSGNLIIEHLEDIDNGGSGCFNSTLIITRIYRATDLCGNTASCSQVFTYELDEEAPVIEIPASDLTVECDGFGNNGDLNAWLDSNGGSTASDNCSNVNWSNDFSNIEMQCGFSGIVIVTFTVSDECNNPSQTTATFIITDTSPPDILCPVDLTISCSSSTDPGNTGLPVLSDFCSENISSDIIDDTSGMTECGQTGVLSRVFIATDDCGNSSSCVQSITVEDNVAPVLICPVDVTILCDDSIDPSDTGLPLVEENCGSFTLEYIDEISGDCPGIINRTFTVFDECGNASTCSHIITLSPNIGNRGVENEMPKMSLIRNSWPSVMVQLGYSELLINDNLIDDLIILPTQQSDWLFSGAPGFTNELFIGMNWKKDYKLLEFNSMFAIMKGSAYGNLSLPNSTQAITYQGNYTAYLYEPSLKFNFRANKIKAIPNFHFAIGSAASLLLPGPISIFSNNAENGSQISYELENNLKKIILSDFILVGFSKTYKDKLTIDFDIRPHVGLIVPQKKFNQGDPPIFNFGIAIDLF